LQDGLIVAISNVGLREVKTFPLMSHIAICGPSCPVAKWLKRVASRRPRRPPPWILGCHARIGQTLRSDLFTEFTLRTLAHVGMKRPIAAVRLRDTNLAAL